MQIAFHKGTKRLFNILTSWWTAGPFSHCELVLELYPDKTGLCASSSFMDGGVRTKVIDISTDDWVVVDLATTEEQKEKARQWFAQHAGQKYDTLGLAGFLYRPFGGDANKWFCSEAVAESLGFVDSWRFDPNTLHAALVSQLPPQIHCTHLPNEAL